jgi:O-antigen/teichoic acid export membrane protein
MIGGIASRARRVFLLLRLRPFDTSTPEGRATERHRGVALSALASAIAKAISIATALISVPLTLGYLGPERFGMWMTMSSFVVMLSFADLGIGNGLMNAVAGAHGKNDRLAIRGFISSSFFVLMIIALMILVLFAASYRFVPWFKIFNVESDLARREAGPAFAVFIVCFALAIPTSIVDRVQMGLQRGFVASFWQCLASTLGLIGVVIAIQLEAGLHWLVLAFVGAPLVASVLNSIVFFGRLEPDIAPTTGAVSGDAVVYIARMGALFLVLQISFALAFASDSIIIAQMLGAAAVAQYTVPEKMFSLISMILTMVLRPLWPAYAEAIARGDNGWVRRTLKRSLLTAVGFSAPISMILVFAGPWIIGLWVGHAVEPPFLLLLGLGLWKVIEAGGNAVAMFLNGAHIVKLQVVIACFFACSCILLKWILVGEIGVSGTVWATIATYLVLATVPYLVLVPRILADIRRFH